MEYMSEWKSCFFLCALPICKKSGYVKISSITSFGPKSGLFPGTRLVLP